MKFKLDGNETRSRSRISVLLLASFFLVCAIPQAGAETLDAQAVKGLVSGHTLKLKFAGSGAVVFWRWRSDGTLCPAGHRLEDRECVDNGTWKVDGNRLCWELSYLGGTEGWKSNCLRIVDHGQGRYEALEDNGMTFWEFSVAE